MAFLKKARDYLVNPANRRRVLFVSLGFIGVVAAVLFLSNLTSLFDRPGGSQAAISHLDANKVWQSLQATGAVKAPHSKSIVVTQNDGTWLYNIGGLTTQINQALGRKQAVVLREVRRIALDPDTGQVIGTAWEGGASAPWGQTNLGHMEFGLIRHGNFLYVVGGDINIPTLTQQQSDVSAGLPYATIERLDLTNPSAGWKVFSLLAGVNYYPEVTIYKNNLHIVGGVLGNPFPPIDPSISGNDFNSDIVNGDNPATRESETRWGNLGLGNVPVVSGIWKDGKPTIMIPHGNFGDTIMTGSPHATRLPQVPGTVPQQGGTTGQGPSTGGSDTGGQTGLNQQTTTTPGTSGSVNGVQIQQTGGLQNVRILYPNGGPTQVFNAGEVVEVTWLAPSGINPSANVNLSYSVDSGTTWIPINPSWETVTIYSNNCIPDGQPYSIPCYKWTIPQDVTPSKNALVRISGFAFNQSFADASDNFFEIKGTYLSQKFIEAIASGKFVTTVSESYRVNPSNPTNPMVGNCATAYTCELGSDFTGALSDKWEKPVSGTPQKAMKLGHVRFTIADDLVVTVTQNPLLGNQYAYTPTNSIIPLPQGRYGHKLMSNSNNLYVVGGASWQKEITITTGTHDLGNGILSSSRKTENFKMFWVVDDNRHPVYDSPRGHQFERPDFNFGFARSSYEFQGNITYWFNDSGSRWVGTNPAVAVSEPSGSPLSGNLALKNSAGSASKGRAFFAFASPNPNRFLVTSGLINMPSASPNHPSYDAIVDGTAGNSPATPSYFRIPVSPIAMQSQKIDLGQGSTAKWDREADTLADGFTVAMPALYNLQVGNLDGGVVVYTGQEVFESPFAPFGNTTWKNEDPHVPDYTRVFSPQTTLYIDPGQDQVAPRWYEMASLNADDGETEVAYVVITPGSSVIQPLGTKQYTAQAYDRTGTPITQGVTYFWQSQNLAVGYIDENTANNPTATFIARDQSGTATLTARATYNGQNVTGRAYAVVNTGNPSPVLRYVQIVPGSVRVGLGEQRQFTARAYDQYGQLVSAGVNYTWTVSGQAGTIQGSGPTAQFTTTSDATKAGQTFNDAIEVRATDDSGNATGTAHVTIKTSAQAVPIAGFGSSTVGDFGTGMNQLKNIYHFGGLDSDVLYTLGAFGTPADPAAQRIISVEIIPDTIPPDSQTFALVRVSIKNGLGQPVWEPGDGNQYGVRIETDRSSMPVATTDGSFRAGKVDRVEILGNSRIPDEAVGFPEGFGEYLYFDNNLNADGLDLTGPGQAAFRIYSKQLTPASGMTVEAFVEIFGNVRASLDQPASAILKVANIDSLPTATNSSIVADPVTVPADGVATSTITVTLRDYKNAPATGYYVRLLSDRNADGVTVDTISPATGNEPLVDANGQVQFTIKSSQKGRANLFVSFDKVKASVDNTPDLPNSAVVAFTGMITSLSPDRAKQGQGPFDLTAVGQKTSWVAEGDDATTIAFIPPSSKISFTAPAGYIYPADAFSTPTFNISAPEFARKQVTLSVESGGGSIFGASTITLDAAGNGHFQYETGATPGPVRIKAQIASGPSDILLIALTDSSQIQPYFLELLADNPTIAPNGETVIRAGIYKHTASGRELQTNANIQLSVVADAGSFSPTSPTTTNGLAAFTYTSGARIGINHIFVSGNYGGFVITEMVSVAVEDASDGITFALPLQVENGQPVAGSQTMVVSGVQVSQTAYLGVWTFRTMTPVGGGIVEVVDHSFTVTPDNRPKGPRIQSLVPNIGYRGDSAKTVVINASETHFAQGSSEVTFTPVGQNADATGITVASTTVESPTRIVVNLNIASTAFAGFWNVKVETDFGLAGVEVAELLGNSDFLVTTQSNYVIDITPTPNRIPRDGKATSRLDTFVGYVNPTDGQITPVSGAQLTYSFVEADGGSFDNTTAITDGLGKAQVVYKTDSGTESQFARIMATATIEGQAVIGFTGVIKETLYGNFLRLTASPGELPLNGSPSTALLTAEAKDRDGNPIDIGNDYIPVEFMIISGSGQVIPIESELELVGGKSQAASTYYRAAGLTQPETAILVATATLPGIGTVFSNNLDLNIGADSSEYLTTITCDPVNCTTAAGSGEPVTLTARLTRNGAPVSNWTVNFSLGLSDIGDYLTKLSGVTDANGSIQTKFIPGAIPGFVTFSAKPVGTIGRTQTITKSYEDTVDITQSTISAVPALVPADNSAYSVITVTLRNRYSVELPGRIVNLASNRSGQDLISVVPNGPIVTQATTNNRGQAIFYVRSGFVGTPQLTASFSGMSRQTQIEFVSPGSVVAATLNIKVPLEAKQYDGAVYTYVVESGLQSPVIREIYVKAFDGSDLLTGLPTIYLRANKNYTAWVKDKYHLAKSAMFSSGAGGNIMVNLPELLIGDVTGVDNTGKLLPSFHDNAITSGDFQPINDTFGETSYLVDYWQDGQVNGIDLLYWIRNFGAGTPHP